MRAGREYGFLVHIFVVFWAFAGDSVVVTPLSKHGHKYSARLCGILLLASIFGIYKLVDHIGGRD